MQIDWPSFMFGFACCFVTPLIDIIAVNVIHKRREKENPEI